MTLGPQLSMTLVTFAADAPTGSAHIRAIAGAAESAGFDRLVVSDHVAFGESLDAYSDPASGGVAGGRQPTGPDGHWLEPLTTIAHLAAATSTIRFGTNILLAALRRPVVLAKMAATVDVLSDGRLDLGVGVGWQRAEYLAAGLEFSERGKLLDHTLSVCSRLWSERSADFNDERLEFESIHQMPKPTHRDGVPIWIGGTVNPAAMRRLAEYGRGWIPWGVDAAEPVIGISRMREAVASLGRDPSSIEVVGSLPTITHANGKIDLVATMGAVERLWLGGVTDFRAHLRPDPDDPRMALRLADFADAFRQATDDLGPRGVSQ